MAKLLWGSPGERYFESGVDRGVLFIDSAGYAWSGLISVSEKSSGGEIQPYYLDGIKYAQIQTAEDFNATLVAYSSPREFAECDGSYEIYAGFVATQQKRKSFGLSYRTKVGSDTDVDLGYKLHIIYNALAAPADRDHSTQSQSPDPTKISWDIETIPEQLSGVRPTAHFVIDSRTADFTALSSLEDTLYGTDVTSPSLPTPTELAGYFA